MLAPCVLCACSSVPPPPSTGDLGSRVDGGTGGFPDGGVACEVVNVEAVRDQPHVMIVLDRSGSMYNDLVEPVIDRWTPAVAAINATLDDLGDSVAFGISLFGSSQGTCGAGDVLVGTGPGTADTISAVLLGDPALLTGGGTPVTGTLTELQRFFERTQPEEANHVVLITDGGPNCNPAQGVRTECICTFDVCFDGQWLGCLDDNASVQAVDALADAGVPTWVIGYETGPLEQATLNAMAAAGGTGTDQFIPVTDQATLSSALSAIAADLVSCTYALGQTPDNPTFVRVTIDGVTIPGEGQAEAGEELGWRLSGSNVVLEGSACESLQDGQPHEVVITRECNPIFIE